MRAVPLRLRLAGAFTITTAVVLAVIAVFLHVRLGSELDATLRTGLRQRAADLIVVARDGASGLGRSALVDPGDDLAQVLDASGRVVDGAPGFNRRPLATAAEVRNALRRPLEVDRRRVGDDDEAAMLLVAPAGKRVVVVGVSLEGRDDALSKLDGLMGVGSPLGLALAGFFGFVVAGRGLRPIDRMREGAEAIGAEHLGERLPEPLPDDELRRLARTLNGMLDRLEDGFARERAFVADASHELRTPLASLRAELELAGRPGRSHAELRAAIASAAEETERLVRLAENLLVVARADAGQLRVVLEDIDVPAFLARVCAAQPVTVTAAAGLIARADAIRLEQALGNLVDNALRHGEPPIEVRARDIGGRVHFEVEDFGAGFPAALGERAFVRFTRGDEARGGEGAGLGLAIVKSIADAHGTTVGCEGGDGRWVVWIETPGTRETGAGP